MQGNRKLKTVATDEEKLRLLLVSMPNISDSLSFVLFEDKISVHTKAHINL